MLILFYQHNGYSQQPTTIPQLTQLDELQALMSANTDEIRIFNFWATWCAPCVKELPLLESYHGSYNNFPVKVYLLSMDFPEQLSTRLLPFVKNRELKSFVYLVNVRDQDAMITSIDEKWSGAIPATLVVNNSTGKASFFEGALNKSKLEQMISSVKN